MKRYLSKQTLLGFALGVSAACAVGIGQSVFAENPVPPPAGTPAVVPPPTNLGGFYTRVRNPGEKDFSEQDKQYNVEVFLDQARGNVVYLTDTGSIAVVPAR